MGRRVVRVDDEIPMDRLLVVATSVDRGDISHAPGTHYVDGRELSELPFCELLTTVTDDLTPYLANEGTGLYVVCQRVIKAGTANVYALFPLVRRADKTHAECDAHWRDTHAALALAHHRAMTHYVQLSVLATLQGSPYDGFALCGFQSIDDLNQRFYTTPASRQVITEDVSKFADLERSPRRLIAKPHVIVG